MKNRDWASIHKDLKGYYNVYRGDGVYLGSFKTKEDAKKQIEIEELEYVH